jgi:hypothetical protein
MKEIEEKAEKIRQKRISAATPKTIESMVFEFFKNAEDSRLIHNNEKYAHALVNDAYCALKERIEIYDFHCFIRIEWNDPMDPFSDTNLIRGITIEWSPGYIARNNVEPILYVDISQMLLF